MTSDWRGLVEAPPLPSLSLSESGLWNVAGYFALNTSHGHLRLEDSCGSQVLVISREISGAK